MSRWKSYRYPAAHPSVLSFPIPKPWVPLDKSEGGVKDKDFLAVR